MTRIEEWWIDCECLDCRCNKYVRITEADEDGDYLRVCNDCIMEIGHEPR